MNAPVRGLALGVSPEGPEDESYSLGDRVSWKDDLGRTYHATVTEVFDDCLDITLDVPSGWYAGMWGPTRLVFVNELCPIDTPKDPS